MRYDSYKHYVLCGHPDTLENWIRYELAYHRENNQTGKPLNMLQTEFIRRTAAANYKSRFDWIFPARL